MLHRPQDRVIFLPAHAKLSDADSLLLKEGQIGIYDIRDTGVNGCKAITSFDGKPRDDKRYEIRIGRNEQLSSRSVYDKDFSTRPFALNEIRDIYAAWPKRDKAYHDDVIIGYDGIDDAKAIVANKGDRIWIKVVLEGYALELLGYDNGKVEIEDFIYLEDCDYTPNQCETCDPCEEVDILPAVLKCIERIKTQPIAGGNVVGDYIDVTPVTRCDNAGSVPTTETVNFYCMEVCDTNDNFALAEVQSQYPGLKIVRSDVRGSKSLYKVIKKGTKPADYEQKLVSLMKGCEDCPPNYTAVEGGHLYSVSLEDDGVDMSTTVEGLANAVAGTVSKLSQNKGTGLYMVAASKKLTDAEIKTFVDANPTVIISYVAKVADMCKNPAISKVSWTACGSCEVATEKYYITLPNDECGDTALEDLRSRYPELEITDYGTPAACQQSFQTTVMTNMLCEECDPVFEGFFSGKAPDSYMNREWKLLTPAQTLGSNCKCGIRFRGKDILLSPSECLVDDMAYIEDSVKIAVSGGYPEVMTEGAPVYYEPLAVQYMECYAPRTFVGGNMLDDEKEGYAHFNGAPKHQNFIERTFMNEYSRVDFRAQYVDFQIVINPVIYAQGFGKRIDDDPVNLILRVPFGGHEGVQEMVNMLGSAAGLGPQIVTQP